MKKRIACLLLAFVMLIGVLPISAITASATSPAISASGVKVIKEFMGFKKEAYKVGSDWFIGYGTPSVEGAVITEAKADLALREKLAALDAEVTAKATAASITLVQKQHDALVWYSYVYGTGLITNKMGALKTAVANGDSSEIANILCTYGYESYPATEAAAKSASEVITARMAIANLFVNGTYSAKSSGSFAMTLFSPNGGNFGGDTKSRVQVYDTKSITAISVATPVNGSKVYTGWYSKDADDKYALVTGLGSATSGKTLYALWQNGGKEVAVNYTLPASVICTASGVDEAAVRKSADPSAEKIDVLKGEDSVQIVAEKIVVESGKNVKWLKLASGGWVRLGELDKIPTIVSGVKVTITDDYVNIREESGVTAKKVGTAQRGETLYIYMTVEDGSILWGYCTKGWIALMYTDYFDAIKAESNASADTVKYTGTVVCASTLNIRRRDDATSTKMGTLPNGARVEIYEIVNGWGRIDKGWICLQYVNLDSKPVVTTPSSGTGISGVVINTPTLNVRAGAGVGNDKVGELKEGDKVTVYEQVTVDNALWGRIDGGWVALNYIRMDESPVAMAAGSTATVSGGVTLVVRSGPGSEYAKVTTLAAGTTVTILQKQTVGGVAWGKIAEGWINLGYVSMSASAQTVGNSGTVVNCSDGVKIRSAAGTSNAIVGLAPVGSRVVLTERTLVNGHYWGKMDKGWVCMDYIQLDSEWKDPAAPADTSVPVEAPAAFVGYPAVISSETPVYQDANPHSKVLLTLKATATVMVESRKLVLGKEYGKVTVGNITGWVAMDDLTLDTLYAYVTTKASAYEKPDVRSKFYAALVVGTPVEVTEQKFDGTYVWGKITCTDSSGDHVAWIILSNVTMYPDNKMPTGVLVMNGVGYMTGKVNTAGIPVYADKNGHKTAEVLGYKLVEGHRVNIQARELVSGVTYAKISIDNTVGWIEMTKIDLDPVTLQVTEDGFKVFTLSDANTLAKTVDKGTKVTVIERVLVAYAGGINDYGKVYIDDEASELFWVILDEGKLSMVSEKPADSGVATSVLTSVVVTGAAKADPTNLYEEAATGSKVLLYINKDTVVTALNWKLVNGTVWCKVQVGDITGWVKFTDIDFTGLQGKVADAELKVYGKADTGSAVQILRVKDRVILIQEMQFDGSILWGKIAIAEGSGWVNLAQMKLNVSTPAAKAIATAKVNSVGANVTLKQDDCVSDSLVIVPKGTSVNLIDVKISAGKAFWLVDMGSSEKNGWISMENLTMNAVTATVLGSDLDVYEDLSVGAEVIYTLYREEKVNINRLLVDNDNLYGEITVGDEYGWILVVDSASNKYVSLTPGSTAPSTTTTPATTAPAEVPTTTPVQTYVTGTVVGTETLKVRSGAGTNYPEVSTVTKGTVLRIYEQVTVIGHGWGRIDTGWVCMDYVQLGTTSGTAVGGTTPGTPTIVTSVPAGAIAVGYAKEDLKIRAGSGLGYEVVGTVLKNNSIVIYERKLDGGMSWGRTSNGWVCLSYMVITGIGSSSNATIANAGFAAAVRATARYDGAEMAKVMVSSRVYIYETTVTGSETWGRTDLGWINMSLVVMDASATPVTPSEAEFG